MNKAQILRSSKQDIVDDYKEFSYLLSDARIKLKKAKASDHNLTFSLEKSYLNTSIEDYSQVKWNTLKKVRSTIRQATLLSIENEWQSPSFTYQDQPMKGVHTGRVSHTINDYKRDQHHLAANYQKQFASQYLSGASINCLLTSSGMSAFSTINHYLKNVLGIKNVLLGNESYFEVKHLVHQTYEKVVEFDELDANSLKDSIINNNTQAIFLDSISNSPLARYVSLSKIVSAIKKVNKKILLVIDNTVGTFLYKPYFKNKNIEVISFESLNKYHQFGLDMVTGGVIYSKNKHIRNLKKLRMHMGTNIEDASALLIPSPKKSYLIKRLERITRNSNYVSSYISDHLNTQKVDIITISSKAKISPYFIINTKGGIGKKKNLCKKIYHKASKHGVEISGGTSFGLSTSRLYLTALSSDETTPFIRFSSGNETLFHTDKLAKLLTKSINSF